MYQVNSNPFCPDLSNEIVLWDLINQIKRSMCANHKGRWDMELNFHLSSEDYDCSSVCDVE